MLLRWWKWVFGFVVHHKQWPAAATSYIFPVTAIQRSNYIATWQESPSSILNPLQVAVGFTAVCIFFPRSDLQSVLLIVAGNSFGLSDVWASSITACQSRGAASRYVPAWWPLPPPPRAGRERSAVPGGKAKGNWGQRCPFVLSYLGLNVAEPDLASSRVWGWILACCLTCSSHENKCLHKLTSLEARESV